MVRVPPRVDAQGAGDGAAPAVGLPRAQLAAPEAEDVVDVRAGERAGGRPVEGAPELRPGGGDVGRQRVRADDVGRARGGGPPRRQEPERHRHEQRRAQAEGGVAGGDAAGVLQAEPARQGEEATVQPAEAAGVGAHHDGALLARDLRRAHPLHGAPADELPPAGGPEVADPAGLPAGGHQVAPAALPQHQHGGGAQPSRLPAVDPQQPQPGDRQAEPAHEQGHQPVEGAGRDAAAAAGGDHGRRAARYSAGCSARVPATRRIWARQEVPAATATSAPRAAGTRRSSAMRRDSSGWR